VVFTELTNHAAPRRTALPFVSRLCWKTNEKHLNNKKKYIKISTDGSGVQWHSLRGLLNSVEKKDC